MDVDIKITGYGSGVGGGSISGIVASGPDKGKKVSFGATPDHIAFLDRSPQIRSITARPVPVLEATILLPGNREANLYDVLPERTSYAKLPFGMVPRNAIGGLKQRNSRPGESEILEPTFFGPDGQNLKPDLMQGSIRLPDGTKVDWTSRRHPDFTSKARAEAIERLPVLSIKGTSIDKHPATRSTSPEKLSLEGRDYKGRDIGTVISFVDTDEKDTKPSSKPLVSPQ